MIIVQTLNELVGLSIGEKERAEERNGQLHVRAELGRLSAAVQEGEQAPRPLISKSPLFRFVSSLTQSLDSF